MYQELSQRDQIKLLETLHVGVTPASTTGYKADTTIPSAVISDTNETIIFADLAGNYRGRPAPETFIWIWDERSQTLAALPRGIKTVSKIDAVSMSAAK